ncbi:MAG: exodeoxyribonuclease VII large subunit [Eubacteriales bacterium]|nr:exodeoxyribonuclease VII large subunit [Eubacteriales bacterium]
MSQPVSVTELNRYVALYLEKNEHLNSIQVKGEISGLKVYASGHLYFTLKDANAQVSCVMFKGQATRLRFKPVDGTAVVVTAKASLYDRDGKFQLYVSAMNADGIGDLYLAFEQLKKRLDEEGLFDPAHKKAIPRLPKAIGVVTSPSGAVIRDIIQVLSRRFPNFRLQLIPVQVQGEGAAASIAAAIDRFNQLGSVDVLIVGRGGGSLEDLWAFNEEVVARSVYRSKIPVISAVGHETDFTICDFVADLRAPTPSAAAELAMPVKSDEEDKIKRLENRLHHALSRKSQLESQRLDALLSRPVLAAPLKRIELEQRELEALVNHLRSATQAQLDRSERNFAVLSGKLDALSPLKVLARGYAVARDAQGKSLVSTALVQPGDPVDVWLSDGRLECTVNQIRERSFSS